MTDIEILNLKEIKELIVQEHIERFYSNSFIPKSDFYVKINYREHSKNNNVIFCYYFEYENNNLLIRERWMIFNIKRHGLDNIIKAYRRNILIDKII